MDPQTCWERLLSAYTEGDWDQIEEAAGALLGWLENGGFPPKVTDLPNLGPEWQRALARAGCNIALDMVHARWSSTENSTSSTCEQSCLSTNRRTP